MKYLQELECEELPEEGRAVLPELETLKFIREGRNIVMYGNPGTGKTHIAIGLEIKACLEGYNVFSLQLYLSYLPKYARLNHPERCASSKGASLPMTS